MFAFAIWDSQTRTLFGARDRLGIKPFYYALDGARLLFASEIKAILAVPFAVEMESASVADYLTFQFCLGDRTLFRGVHKLLPGHTLEFTPGSEPVVRRYWEPDYSVDAAHDLRHFEEQLRELLNDAVRLQLRADVPIGAHLSGGLDSTAVTCLARSLGADPFHTFSGAFDEGDDFDESRYAALVSKRTGTIHHEVRPTAAQFVDAMPKIAYAMDEPAGGPGVFPQYLVSAAARHHVKVVLGGQGADEVFGGYTRYLVMYLEASLKGAIHGTSEDDRYVVTFESILPNLRQLEGYEPMLRHFWSEGLFGDEDRRYFSLISRTGSTRAAIAPEFWSSIHEHYDPFDAFAAEFNRPGCSALINRMTRFDLNTLLPALLQVEDRTSMAVSLESRVPLLDHRIVELAASMPPKVKFQAGRSKHIFREAVRPIVPQEVFARTDKKGFPVPLARWYRSGPVRDFVSDVLHSASSTRRLARPDVVDAVRQQEGDFDRGVWGLLNLELWMQTFVDRSVTVSH
ncbi:MAG TPA: asparagine synthase (glutamine-hydrolyzing), partial [Vicinamibacterales bacterium]|nr:asparagine synthase (glutamine-hydrolyzing) [Vicinamibacterales bacterium]